MPQLRGNGPTLGLNTQLPGDSWYLKVISNLQSGRQLDPKYEGYTMEIDRLLRYRGRMYILENGDI
jgi:hypothetical protein